MADFTFNKTSKKIYHLIPKISHAATGFSKPWSMVTAFGIAVGVFGHRFHEFFHDADRCGPVLLNPEIVNASSVKSFKAFLDARWQSLFPEVPI